MTRRETRLVLSSLILGAALAAAASWAVWVRKAPEVQAPPALPVSAPADGSPQPAGIALSEEEQQRIGVELSEVATQRFQREITAPARVEAAETALHAVSARIGGRVENLFVNFTGQSVRAGQTIATIYSPQVFTASQEYKLAIENRQRLNTSREAEAIAQADSLIDASRRRLELWGLTAEQVASIALSSSANLLIDIYSPVAGIVTKRIVAEGQYVETGAPLFEVSDLSSIWVVADVFQTDIGAVRVGQSVAILPGDGGGNLRGTVRLIEVAANPDTRTVPVRIELANPQMRLKPGMIVQAALTISSSPAALSVPRSAVIDTGEEKIVYVAAGDGVFERRVIEVGAPIEGSYPVVAGLRAGERVVTHGAFMIDSQTRLTGGLTGLFGGSKEFAPETARSSGYKITFQMEPTPVKAPADNNVHVTVLDHDGRPVSDAQVTVNAIMPPMPSMGMPEMRGTANLKWTGSDYGGVISVAMAGSWNVAVEVRRNGAVVATYRTSFSAK